MSATHININPKKNYRIQVLGINEDRVIYNLLKDDGSIDVQWGCFSTAWLMNNYKEI